MMKTTDLSIGTIWANLRALPKPLWKQMLTAIAIYCAANAAIEAIYGTQATGAGAPPSLVGGIGAMLLPFIGLLLAYGLNRLIAAHDRKEEPTRAFIASGFMRRVLLPFAGIYVLVILAAIAIVYLTIDGLWSAHAPRPGMTLAMIAAMLILVGLTVYISLRLTCVMPVIAFEEVGFIAAIKRSWQMSRGHVGSILSAALGLAMMALVAALVWLLVVMLISMPFGGLPSDDTPANSFAGGITFLLTFGFVWITTTPSYLLSTAIYRLLRDNEQAEGAQA